MVRNLSSLLLLLLGAPLLRAEAIDYRQLPAGATWFVHLDFDAARSSVLAREIRDAWFIQPEAKRALDKAIDTLGIDPTRDIRSITIFGAAYSPSRGVMILHGKVNRSHLDALLKKASGYHTETVGGHLLQIWNEPNSPSDAAGGSAARVTAGAFFGEDRVVLCPDPVTLAAALDVLDGTAASLALDSPLVVQPAPGTVVLAGATGLADAKMLPMQSPLLRQCESGSLVIGERGGAAFLHATVQTRSPETASQLRSLIEGARAMAQLQAADDADIARLLQPLKVVADEAKVAINWQFASAEIISIVQSHQQRLPAATQSGKDQ